MVGNRDEFASKIKENLARRAGHQCSNPSCGVVTSGPHQDEDRAINVGVAAHITAASPGGPRYNEFLTPEERSSITNAIWLCQKCAKLIDSDVKSYNEELIRIWKRQHEASIKAQIEGTTKPRKKASAPAQLSIDAVFSNPSADNKACVLDIRVSNPGGSDLMINSVEFQVLETLQQLPLGHAAFSAQYDLDIGKLLQYGARGECQVAQILKPGEVDRFAIILSAPRGLPGGWRFGTVFKTNVGEVGGPDIEIWLSRPRVIPSFDEVTSSWLLATQMQNIFTGKDFQELASGLTDQSSPEKSMFSKFRNTGGGAFAFPSVTGGYETHVAFDYTIGIYRGPRPLWERGGPSLAEMRFGKPELVAAKRLYQLYGAAALEKAESRRTELAEKGNAKAVEDWKRVLRQIEVLIEQDIQLLPSP